MNIIPPILLIVDDDDVIRSLLSKYLKENGFLTIGAANTGQAMEALEEVAVDLIILDRMMPGKSGTIFAQEFREKSDIPIIMLTALGEIHDRIEGLETGIDDYMSKPFEPKELLLRINRILARVPKKAELVNFGEYSFDLSNSRLYHKEQVVFLTSGEEKLLKLLIQNSSKIVTRESLAKECGGINERSVDVQVIRLRNKIEADPKNPSFIQTIRSQGYIFKT